VNTRNTAYFYCQLQFDRIILFPYLVTTVIVVGLAGLHQLSKGSLIFSIHLVKCKSGTSLSTHNTSQSSLALHNAVRHTHLTAQHWQVKNELQIKMV